MSYSALLNPGFWKPAEELNLSPFRPTLLRFGLEDRCRERGPGHCRFSIANCRLVRLTNVALMRTSEYEKAAEIQTNRNRKLAIGNVKWSGREADPPLRTPRSPAVTVLPGMSHAPIKLVQSRGTLDVDWCPRKDSNLQPLVCRTSAQSVELLGRGDWFIDSMFH